MRFIKLLTCVVGLLHSVNLMAQKYIETSPARWSTYNSKVNFNKDTIHLINTAGKTAFLWLNNTNFRNGVIELDVKGKDLAGQSFVGVAFHATDNENYDAVYFRPFNFKNPEKKERAVQYIDKPDNDWDKLRQQYPGKYEGAVNPVPDPNDWFHVRIVIDFPQVKVYLANAGTPSLQVEQISKRKEGKFGLWIDCDEGWFKNVKITRIN
jgi:hypothetical protein